MYRKYRNFMMIPFQYRDGNITYSAGQICKLVYRNQNKIVIQPEIELFFEKFVNCFTVLSEIVNYIAYV